MSDLLSARDLWKKYRGHSVLAGADLVLAGGEITGLIGPNGVGKTTLLRLLSGFIRPDAGVVSTESGVLPHGTGPRGLAQFGGGHTIPPRVSARSWARDVSEGAWKGDERRRVRDLSRGTRQILGLEATLARPGTSIVLLDEPWEGLDPNGARWLNAALAERSQKGAAILVSSHRLHELAEVCDRFAFLRDGLVSVRSREEMNTARGPNGLLEEFDRRSEPS